MNYRQTLQYLYNKLPMFQRVGAAAYKANLDNTYALLDILSNPHKHFKSVHIAGTNGKGSVSHLLASILQEAGYKTALYTSPHLKDFRERIRINGKMIPEEEVVSFVERYARDFERIKPSFFEMTVGMAFKYFEEQKVDIAVLEVGMGGRLDSTNVVRPELSIITNISYDHTDFLGESLEKIAVEKAGIIKKHLPVVIGEMQEETTDVFLNKAHEMNAELSFADQNLSIQRAEKFTENDQPKYLLDISKGGMPHLMEIELPLTGLYQLKNLITTLQSVEILAQRGYNISPAVIFEGINKVRENTGFVGRWLILGKNPTIICDTAHNVEGMRHVLSQLGSLQFEKMHFVLGMVNDKEIDKILQMLPKKAVYYFCKADIPRGLESSLLKRKAEKFGLSGNAWASVQQAFDAAKRSASPNDLVFVGGSTFVVAEVI
ncbi:MAG: bifunctional folylpolyglutamate synthase/dihydrofolate synthase [Bacteroidales bacterium]|nr:bifunctional folylpolyglutamate synthase/dihydrofolate synthase [Bacteroidales bacterium]MCF8344244.1 bifunctional folylpolyglutamate synthase/dihydrofolate synthase [Bacteroidales bacterium]MCF8350706.1 bifunctional folylpolyglutamate synthase/dihydrofolate synthase [Bacteroidales bacterium]MCF8377517.1 bifunctional folylpolyglutamate synthase/dihydrofolate synthase [Bacteroidales bacterium]MCF8401816.1 bifunctional folylpolyglutamate synthase/dihydrofolate synthase [Bacteroidales bacterium